MATVINPDFSRSGCRVSTDLSTSENGWPLRPFQIVSLLEMITKFPVGVVASSLVELQRVSLEVDLVINSGKGFSIVDDHEVIATRVRKCLDSLRETLTPYGFQRTTERVQDLHEVVPNSQCRMSIESLRRDLEKVRDALVRDLSEKKFFWMPKQDADYYGCAELFGSEVATRFPVANADITEAGNCYAAGNHSACVFHLTRVLERGLFVLAQDANLYRLTTNPVLKVNVAHVSLETWETLINKVESAVLNVQKNASKSPQKIETVDAYSGAALHFRYFKDHWRNPISHSRSSYDRPQAKSALGEVEGFMRHLATKLNLREDPSSMVLP